MVTGHVPGPSAHAAGRLALPSCPAQCERERTTEAPSPELRREGRVGGSLTNLNQLSVLLAPHCLPDMAPLTFPSSLCTMVSLPGGTGKGQREEKTMSASL